MKSKKINPDELPLKRFRNELDGMFQRFFDEPVLSNMPFVNSDLRPACNIVESKNSYSIEVEIPGIEADDIDIEIDNHILKIRGERKQETEHKMKKQRFIQWNIAMALFSALSPYQMALMKKKLVQLIKMAYCILMCQSQMNLKYDASKLIKMMLKTRFPFFIYI